MSVRHEQAQEHHEAVPAQECVDGVCNQALALCLSLLWYDSRNVLAQKDYVPISLYTDQQSKSPSVIHVGIMVVLNLDHLSTRV